MRKWLLVVGIGVGALVLVLAGAAYAASTATRVAAAQQGGAAAYGLMRERMGMGAFTGPQGIRAQLQADMLQALADRLNISSDDLESRLGAGQTLTQVAEAQGIPQDGLRAILQESWSNALRTAVSDGALTQAQADRLEDHPALMMMGAGSRMRGMWGRGPMGQGFSGRW